MLRHACMCFLVLTSATSAVAQYGQSNYGSGYAPIVQNYQPGWTTQLVKPARHNFGVVARGSEHSHVFEFVNPLKTNIALGGVRASCGCATPSVLTPVVKPGETGKIHVRFNTLSFLGDRHARITVTVTAPSYTELYLDIDGHVRRDIVVTPGQVNFASVQAGQSAEQSVDIRYAGAGNWQVTKTECENPHLEVTLQETKREGMRIDYRLSVKLKSTQPSGRLDDQIVLHTNDVSQKQFPITVSGNIKSIIETQSVVDVGPVQQGTPVFHRVVLKSDQEFVVTKAHSVSPRVKIKVPTDKKRLHILEIEVAPDVEGKLNDEIVINTDAQTLPTVIHVVGEVLPAMNTTKKENQ